MAANYDQPPNVEKRVRFFDGQYLQDQDFIDEQKYHVDRQRRHNRTLHIAGIADGLAVNKVDDAPARVTVAAGTAIDSDGRQLLVASAQTVDLPASQLANKTVNLYLVYREQPADLQTQAGSKDYSRWLEQPEIRAVAKGDAVQGNYPPVLLAELMLDGSGNITSVNSNVRQYSGLRLPGPSADGPTLRADASGLVQLAGSLSVTGNVGIGTTDLGTNKLKVTGNTYLEGTLTVTGNTSIGTSGSLSFGSQVRQMINLYSTNYGIGVQSSTQYFRTDKNFAWFKKGTHSDGELTAGTNGTVQMVIKDGSVGIGTSGPAGTLDVQGSVYVGTGKNNENYKLVLRGPNQPGDAGSAQDLSYEFASAGSAKIRAYRGSSWDTYLQFLTNAVDANKDNPQVRLQINHDGNVGIGTTSLGGRLTVGASSAHLQLRRESTETTGGKQLFLELYQYDPDKKVPEVYPSIRFHHNNKFWHRIEARSDGLHIKTGDMNSENYVPLKVGNLQINGTFTVGGGQAVAGIPVIAFQSLQQRFSNQTGSAKMLTYTFNFSRPVVSAVPVLGTWFLRYNNREYVKEAGVGCYATRISDSKVEVDVYFFLKDATGNYDDPYEGEAIVVVIAQLSQAI